MILLLFFKGIAVGIAIAAPVGPVAVLCIRRTLLQGKPAGLASGAGAVLAVAGGATLWWSGLTLAADFLRERVALDRMTWLNKVSGGLIVFFGVAALGSLAVA